MVCPRAARKSVSYWEMVSAKVRVWPILDAHSQIAMLHFLGQLLALDAHSQMATLHLLGQLLAPNELLKSPSYYMHFPDNNAAFRELVEPNAFLWTLLVNFRKEICTSGVCLFF